MQLPFTAKIKVCKQLILLTYIFTLLFLLFSCTSEEHRQKTLDMLAKAATLMEGDAEGALSALKEVNSAYLQKDEYYYYFLLSARVSSMLGVDVSDMGSNIRHAVSYFLERNDAKNLVLAYYVQAKVYEGKRQVNDAIAAYKSADYWAEKANYHIPNFTYAAIPYNIASYHKRSNEYRSSISYLHKSLRHTGNAITSTENTLLLYSLELMGISYMYLDMPDSSFYYYDKAFVLADQMGMTYAKQRITGNRIEMLSNIDNVELAEATIHKLQKEYLTSNDSAFISSTNLSLSRIYAKTNRIDQAYQCIDKSLAYANEADFDNHRLIYNQMLELAKADSTNRVTRDYLDFKHYVEYASKISTSKQKDELTDQIRKKAGELLSVAMNQNESLFLSLKMNKITAYLGLSTSLAMLALIAVRRAKKKPNFLAYMEDVAIVDYIIQSSYTKRYKGKLFSFVEERAGSDQEKVEMIDCLDMYASMNDTTLFNGFKKKIFGIDSDIPILTDQELSVCFLMSTMVYDYRAIMEFLIITEEHLWMLILSLEQKIRKGRYKFPNGYATARRKLQRKPEKYLHKLKIGS